MWSGAHRGGSSQHQRRQGDWSSSGVVAVGHDSWAAYSHSIASHTRGVEAYKRTCERMRGGDGGDVAAALSAPFRDQMKQIDRKLLIYMLVM